MQFEFDPHYHLATINIFFKALQMADANGYRNEFPQSFLDTIENMITVMYNLSFPDYSNPLFSDAKKNSKKFSPIMRQFNILPLKEKTENFQTIHQKHLRHLAFSFSEMDGICNLPA